MCTLLKIKHCRCIKMHTRYSGGDVLLHLQRNKTLGKDAQ
jgi:hypothetical protein